MAKVMLWSALRRRTGVFLSWLQGSRADRVVKSPTRYESLKPRVHIGCGLINLEGWINIDARDAPHVHIVTDRLGLDGFVDGSIGEIYACHVLEHFDFADATALLRAFHSKLRSGGLLRISVPDFRLICESYVGNVPLSALKFAVMGGQDYQFNYHKSIYDYEMLYAELEGAGFRAISRYDTAADFGIDLGDWSTGEIETSAISLNVKAVRLC